MHVLKTCEEIVSFHCLVSEQPGAERVRRSAAQGTRLANSIVRSALHAAYAE